MDSKTTISIITIFVGITTFIINIVWAMTRQDKESLVKSLQESATSKDKHVRLSAIKYITNLAYRKVFFLSFKTENFQSCVNALLILWFYETDQIVRRFCELEWNKIAPRLKGKDIDNIIDTIDCFIHDMNETYLNLYIVKQLPNIAIQEDLRTSLEPFDIKNIPKDLEINMNPREIKRKVLEMKVLVGKEEAEEKLSNLIYQLIALHMHQYTTMKRIMTPIITSIEGRFPKEWYIL